ncbi:uncharacterized protein N7529_007018 [Penicillium soppii]|uniref:uncharacterized protein n=1 Tax=Penicillium soppii TaxID=69789 RepID=UPI00254998A8|nr:uncharacterized protein N7529_007018 [Penicillium soppii]KAJ5865102.1 hypothetical protein N7529_007018 [Penicillium soppii]
MEDNETSSHSSFDSVMTPMHTSLHESYTELGSPPYPAQKIGPPYKGATFIIRDLQRGFVIALTDGNLCLLPDGNGNPLFNRGDGHGNHWRCVENKDRWLGFKNTVSGEFIGHDNNQKHWRFIAKVEAHNEWEYFCVRHHPNGGYEMLVKHWHGFRAMKVGGTDDRELMVAGEGEDGTAWEFVKV